MHLLILDDDPRIAGFLATVATRRGWTTDVAGRESDFQHMFRARRPDAIMLDLQLDDSDGIEQLRFLHGEAFTGAITLISGFDPRVLESARHVGDALGLTVTATIEKPARAAEVGRALQRMERAAAPSTEGQPIAAARSRPPEETLAPARIVAAIEAGELELHLQPIITAGDRTQVRAEGLARWRQPDGGLLTPDSFIPVAERDAAAIDRLTEWAIATGVAHHQRLAATGRHVQICVNISGRNLDTLDFPDRVAALLDQSAVAPGAIGLEVTETVAMQDLDATADILTRLRLKGFALAIDDFGTGHSSLAALRRMPFSTLKIDKSFIADLAKSHDSQAIVRSVIELAHSLGLVTVAEGVESESVAEVLRQLGVGGMQGFHFSRPLPFEGFVGWLERWTAHDPATAN